MYDIFSTGYVRCIAQLNNTSLIPILWQGHVITLNKYLRPEEIDVILFVYVENLWCQHGGQFTKSDNNLWCGHSYQMWQVDMERCWNRKPFAN